MVFVGAKFAHGQGHLTNQVTAFTPGAMLIPKAKRPKGAECKERGEGKERKKVSVDRHVKSFLERTDPEGYAAYALNVSGIQKVPASAGTSIPNGKERRKE
ncbi:MAG: hypothetical protein DMG97_09225 [Acidobacteria bacterium]|nr:MAG: hypothetical protein DMG97_09225 [Acidobacteriota bacterium]